MAHRCDCYGAVSKVHRALHGCCDLEGIVGKWAHGTYRTEGRGTSWLKIKSPEYSQIAGRRELFEMHRDAAARRRRLLAPELRLA